MEITTKDAVETSHTMKLAADDKAAGAVLAQGIAQAAHVCSARVIGYSAKLKVADVHVVYRIAKGVTVDVPADLGERLKALNLA